MNKIYVLCEVRLEFVSDEYSGQAIKTPKFWTANKGNKLVDTHVRLV